MAKLTVKEKKAEKKAQERLTPDLVLVKALHRGYYEVLEVIDIKQPDGTKRKELGRNDVIRNEGEVFQYDTVDMPKWSSLTAQQQDEREMVKTARGEFALPRWVTLATKRDRETVAAGHTTTFRDDNVNAKQTDDDVI